MFIHMYKHRKDSLLNKKEVKQSNGEWPIEKNQTTMLSVEFKNTQDEYDKEQE